MSKNKNLYTKIAVVVLVALAVFFVFTLITDADSEDKQVVDIEGVNLNPPTEQEANAGNEAKERITKELNQSTDSELEVDPQDDSASLTQTEVTIVDASQYGSTVEIRSFMQNIVESGICTYTLKNSATGQETSRTLEASPEASSTTCPTVEVPVSELSVGQWDVTVEFNGSQSQGSATSVVTVN